MVDLVLSRLRLLWWDFFLPDGNGLGGGGGVLVDCIFPGGLLILVLDWHKVPSFQQGIYLEFFQGLTPFWGDFLVLMKECLLFFSGVPSLPG